MTAEDLEEIKRLCCLLEVETDPEKCLILSLELTALLNRTEEPLDDRAHASTACIH